MRHRRLPRIDLPAHSYYLGGALHARRSLFRNAALAEILLGLYVHQRDRDAISLHGYVIMPDHYHVLLTLRGAPSVSGVVRTIHSLFARRCRRDTQLRGRVWQRRFYDHVIRDTEDLTTKLAYIHDNPVRAGLVENPSQYPWSSCRFWEAGCGPIACDGWD